MKIFHLYDLSTNRNSFGLRGAILVAKDGETWEIGTNDLNCPRQGHDYRCPEPDPGLVKIGGTYTFADYATSMGWEIPLRLPKCPQEMIDRCFLEVETVAQAKKAIKSELNRLGLPYDKIKGKTMGFDGSTAIVVEVHGWKPDPQAEALRQYARTRKIVLTLCGDFMRS